MDRSYPIKIALLPFLFSFVVVAENKPIHESQGKGPCKVTTRIPYTTSMGQCHWQDEVMVGISSVDPLFIRCARLEVTCQPDGSRESALHEETLSQR